MSTGNPESPIYQYRRLICWGDGHETHGPARPEDDARYDYARSLTNSHVKEQGAIVKLQRRKVDPWEDVEVSSGAGAAEDAGCAGGHEERRESIVGPVMARIAAEKAARKATDDAHEAEVQREPSPLTAMRELRRRFARFGTFLLGRSS